MADKNLITVVGRDGDPTDINLDDLEVTSDYDVELYRAPKFEARRRYTANEEDDVHNEFYGDAIPFLLEVIQDLNRRLRALESKNK